MAVLKRGYYLLGLLKTVYLLPKKQTMRKKNKKFAGAKHVWEVIGASVVDKVGGALIQGISPKTLFTLVTCSLYPAIHLTFSGETLVLNNTDCTRDFKPKIIHSFNLSGKLQFVAALSLGTWSFPQKENCTYNFLKTRPGLHI